VFPNLFSIISLLYSSLIYEKIYDLDREHRKSKDLVCKLVELLLGQIKFLVKLNEIEKDIVKLEATKQLKDFLGSGVFL